MDLQSIVIIVISLGFVYALIQSFFYLLNRTRTLEDKLASKDTENNALTAVLLQTKQFPAPVEKKYIANPFSTREMQVASLLIEGLINKEIADQLKIATNTVNNHLENMKEKTNCHSKAELVAYLLKSGIVE